MKPPPARGRRGLLSRPVSLAVACALGCSSLFAQEPQQTPGPRAATVLVGVGNDLGWLGIQAERYFLGERLSAFGGLGYTPEIDQDDPTGVTVAAGFRGFTPGRNHRGFLGLSVSQVAIETTTEPTTPGSPAVVEGNRLYGPGIQVGYQYTADRWFTAMISAGVGYPVGAEFDYQDGPPLQAILNIGIGYTWRGAR